MTEPLDTLRNEWPVIIAAPWSVAGLAVLVAAAAYLAAKWRYGGELETVKGKTSRLEDVIRDQRPSKTAFSDLTNSALRESALSLASKIRRYHTDEVAREKSLQKYDAELAESWGGNYKAQANGKTLERQEARASYFQETFKIDAVLIRNEMLSRLPAGQPPGGIWGPGGEYRVDLSQYGNLMYFSQLESIALHLEGLAKLLPNVSASLQ